MSKKDTSDKNLVGITERGDPAINSDWMTWVFSGRPAILITKNPFKLAGMLEKMPTANVIIHCTITGFGSTQLEPCVPYPEDSFFGYEKLLRQFGHDRVVLRVDPIIPTPKGMDKALKVIRVGKAVFNRCFVPRAETKAGPKMGMQYNEDGKLEKIQLSPAATTATTNPMRVRVSFMDNYAHVKDRFRRQHLPVPDYDFHAPMEVRRSALEKIVEAMGGNMVEVCGEPDLTPSLSKATPCISARDCEILKIKSLGWHNDSQRPTCFCQANKHELLSERKPCIHGCLYCYWKTPKEQQHG